MLLYSFQFDFIHFQFFNFQISEQQLEQILTEEQIKQVKQLVSEKLKPNHTRSFLKVKDFTPLYLDLPSNLSKEQILYQLEQAFYNSQILECPLQLDFQKFIKFTDCNLVIADIYQNEYRDKKLTTAPLPAGTFGIQQETGASLSIDNQDFSLFLAKRFPSNFTVQMFIQYITNPLLYVEGSTLNTISVASILFYREKYFTPVQLFNLFVDRFYMRNPINMPSQQMQQYSDIFKLQVKAKVLEIIILWMTYYNDDFRQDDIKQVVNKFITDNETNTIFIDQFVQIKQLLEREESKPYQEDFSSIIARISNDQMNGMQHRPFYMPNRPQTPVFSLYLGAFAAPKSILYTGMYHDESKYSLQQKYSVCPPQRYLQYASGQSLSSASVDLLTSLFYYFLYETYHNIHPRELIGSKQSKEETRNESPNVTLHIRRINIINHFVAKSVIQSSNKKETYAKFLNVAQKLYVLKAYDPCISILSALEWAPVSRFQLKEQMKGINKEYADNLFKLISLGDNFKTIRSLIDSAESTESIIPVLSLATKDCFMSEDNLERYTNGYYINLMRPILVWRSAHAFLRFQAADMRVILFNKEIYEELCQQREIPEDEMWQMTRPINKKQKHQNIEKPKEQNKEVKQNTVCIDKFQTQKIHYLPDQFRAVDYYYEELYYKQLQAFKAIHDDFQDIQSKYTMGYIEIIPTFPGTLIDINHPAYPRALGQQVQTGDDYYLLNKPIITIRDDIDFEQYKKLFKPDEESIKVFEQQLEQQKEIWVLPDGKALFCNRYTDNIQDAIIQNSSEEEKKKIKEEIQGKKDKQPVMTMEQLDKKISKIFKYLIISIILIIAIYTYISSKYLNNQLSGVNIQQLYKTLELQEGATLKQINKAFKKLSIKYHPDKNPNCSDCQQKFQKISNAYNKLKKILEVQEKKQNVNLN